MTPASVSYTHLDVYKRQVCFHALGIIAQNREYLQMHLLASADLPTRQALSDIQIESCLLYTSRCV